LNTTDISFTQGTTMEFQRDGLQKYKYASHLHESLTRALSVKYYRVFLGIFFNKKSKTLLVYSMLLLLIKNMKFINLKRETEERERERERERESYIFQFIIFLCII